MASKCPFAARLASKRRLAKLATQLTPHEASEKDSPEIAKMKTELRNARADILALCDKINCNPILVRLAWHDSGTFDKNSGQGGADGSIRFTDELKHGANAGLIKAKGYLGSIKSKYPSISWADLIQLASATAIGHAGGPIISMRYGRIDAGKAMKEGNLPNAGAPYGDGTTDAAQHLRKVFYRMGFDDQGIVALSGAHTLGRAFAGRSGTVPNGYGDKEATKFTHSCAFARNDGSSGIGMSGGRSWTPKWLKFDNSYFKYNSEPKSSRDELARFATDSVLFVDNSFRKWAELYRDDESRFFKDYAVAHKKLSELGSKWINGTGFTL